MKITVVMTMVKIMGVVTDGNDEIDDNDSDCGAEVMVIMMMTTLRHKHEIIKKSDFWQLPTRLLVLPYISHPIYRGAY